MPSTPQFSRPAPGVMSSGSIRTRITAALALAIWSVDALEQRLAVLVGLEDRGGLGVDQVADLEVGGRIGVPVTSRTTRMPGAQMVA